MCNLFMVYTSYCIISLKNLESSYLNNRSFITLDGITLFLPSKSLLYVKCASDCIGFIHHHLFSHTRCHQDSGAKEVV